MVVLSGRPLVHREVDNSAGKTQQGRTRTPVQVVALLSAVLLGSLVSQLVCAQSTADEYRVKAAFLFHFAQLVEWPAGALNPSDQSINLCIFDDEPHRAELQNTIEGKPVGARVLHVRMLDQQQNTQGCNILFLSRDEGRRQVAILRSVRDLPVLTVGETDTFLADGGMIHFHLDGDKIRFDINVDGANSSHLKISSRLLLLATSVTLGGGTEKGRQSYAR
jgi:hypothetical protein